MLKFSLIEFNLDGINSAEDFKKFIWSLFALDCFFKCYNCNNLILVGMEKKCLKSNTCRPQKDEASLQ